jgi:hypothetical protein
MIFTRVCRRGKTFFSDLDKCPDSSQEIPVTPVLHPKYRPYGSIPISFFYPHFSVLSPFQFPLSVSLSPIRFQRFIPTPFSENGFSGDFGEGGGRPPWLRHCIEIIDISIISMRLPHRRRGPLEASLWLFRLPGVYTLG